MHFDGRVGEIIGSVGITECIVLLFSVGEAVSIIKVFLSELLNEGLAVEFVFVVAFGVCFGDEI